MNLKSKIAASIIFLIPVSITYAETQVIDSPQVCEKRINSYKTALQSAIDAKQNVDASKAELDKISKLSNKLPPCEKQKRIPALANTDEASSQANEALKNKQISP